MDFKIVISLITALLFFLCFSGKASAAETKEDYVNVKGGKIWYKIVGYDKPGIPLIIIHGGPGVPHDYLEPLAELAGERPVIFYDQLGCGNSDKITDKTLMTTERYTDELEALINELGYKKVHLFGQSWGTMLAANYAITKKDGRVKSLILSGPYLSTNLFVKDQRAYLEEFPASIKEVIKKCEAEGNYSSIEYQNAMSEYYKVHLCRLDPWPECMTRAMSKLSTDVYNYMWGQSEFTMTGTLKKADLTEKLKDIKIPVLFICGEFDEATPKTTEYYHKKCPGSKMKVIKNASHSHHLENKDEFLKIVNDFLNNILYQTKKRTFRLSFYFNSFILHSRFSQRQAAQ